MKEGDKARFWIPGALAYGDKPTRPGAPARRPRVRRRAHRDSVARRTGIMPAGCATTPSGVSTRRPFRPACASVSTSTRATTRRSATSSATTSAFRASSPARRRCSGSFRSRRSAASRWTLAEVVAGGDCHFLRRVGSPARPGDGGCSSSRSSRSVARCRSGSDFRSSSRAGCSSSSGMPRSSTVTGVSQEPLAPARRAGLARRARLETPRRRA